VYEKRIMMRIFGPKRGEVIERWRIWHGEELCDLYSPSYIT
jgi:hypothetical protein